jgi:hypothetical protein
MVKVAKRTLDDYIYQIRLGKKLGFDFINCAEDKFKKLRDFNVKAKLKLEQKAEESGEE